MDDITCDDITFEVLHLASMAGMDDITYDNLTCDELNQDVCQNMVLGWMI